MRRWWRAAVVAADDVSARPGLWLPGALAWIVTVGWVPLLAVVARPPSVADLTFLGARIYTAGAWPWNAVAGALVVLGVLALAFVLVALAETTLVVEGRHPPSATRLSRAAAVGAVTSLPALAAVLAGATAFIVIATDEFNAPGTGDPLLRTIVRTLPFAAVAAMAWIGGALVHAAAIRAVAGVDADLRQALGTGAQRLVAAGRPVILAGVVGTLVVRVAYVVLTALLLHVLWRSLAPRIGVSGIDAEIVPLLVGFVAIWLCCVLGGGAVHAWASLTWSSVLGDRSAERAEAGRHAHGDPHRP